LLHRRIMADIGPMIDDVNRILPISMPPIYETHLLNIKPFIKRMNVVTEPHGVFNELMTDVTLPLGQTVVSALWIPDTEIPENGSNADVRILWYVHPKTHRLSLTPLKWDRRRSYFWSRVGHEMVHRHQDVFRPPDGGDARNYRVRTENRAERETQQYLGNYDELEAHAYDAALELTSWYPNSTLRQAIKSVSTVHGNAVISTYNMYMDELPKGHSAILPFQRKVRAWWEQIQKSPDFYARLALPRLA